VAERVGSGVKDDEPIVVLALKAFRRESLSGKERRDQCRKEVTRAMSGGGGEGELKRERTLLRVSI